MQPSNSYLDLAAFADLKENVLSTMLAPFEYAKIDSNPSPLAIERSLIASIDRRLRAMLSDTYDAFMARFSTDNVVITGSFILEASYDLKYGTNDLDIFFDAGDNDLHQTSFLSSIYSKDYDWNANSYHYENMLVTLQHTDYIHNGKILQEVGVKIGAENKKEFIEKIWQHITTNFDFDICANVYYILNGVPHVRLASLPGLIERKIRLMRPNVYTVERRIRKYIERGFTFEGVTPTKDLSENTRLFILTDPTADDQIMRHITTVDDEYTEIKPGKYEVLHVKSKDDRNRRYDLVYNNPLKERHPSVEERLIYLPY